MKKLKLICILSIVSIVALGQATRPFVQSKSLSTHVKPKKSHQISTQRTHPSENFHQLKTTKPVFRNRKKLSLDRELPGHTFKGQSTQTSTFNNYELTLGFEANWFDNMFDPSNSVATNPSGDIVSVANSSIDIYDASGELLYTKLLSEHYALDKLQEQMFFPSVHWDPSINRFIMVSLHGFYAEDSQILVSFSESDDPLGEWFTYLIPGNITDQGTWMDTPLVGFSDNDLFISGSLITDSDDFVENIVFQINKASGIETENMDYNYWNNIQTDASSIYPVSHGIDGPYTPGILMVSSTENGHYLYDITGDTDDANATMEVYEFGDGYTRSFDAFQKGSDVGLDTGDGRITGAFYLDGRIHMVFNASGESEYGEIHYIDLDVETLDFYEDIIAQKDVDLAYPNIIPIGNNITTPEVCIAYLSSSLVHYPSMELITFNGIDEWTSPMMIKEGKNPVINSPNQDYSLWGRYVGLTRKETNTSPNIIFAGQYGTTRIYDGEEPYECLETYIVELQEKAGVSNPETVADAALAIYPNPVKTKCYIDYTSDQSQMLSIDLMSINGKQIHNFTEVEVHPGINKLDVNVQSVKPGVYLLKIEDQQGNRSKRKLTVL